MQSEIGKLMKILEKLISKIKGHQHHYVIRYDERNDLDDDKTHTFRVTLCEECGYVKSIEELQ